MTAEAVYDRIREVIAEESEADEELTMFELIGVIRVIGAELEAATMDDGDEDDDDTNPDAHYDD